MKFKIGMGEEGMEQTEQIVEFDTYTQALEYILKEADLYCRRIDL